MYSIPQMAPMMWFTLFISFSVTLILYNQNNFFSFKTIPIKSLKSSKSKSKNMNWKW